MSRSSGKPAGPPAAIGDLRIPDPRLWPEGARERFCKWRGNCGPLDLSIFVFGPTAAMFLSDAITAAGVLEIDPSEWHIEGNYPAFWFNVEKLGAHGHRLAACGYTVRVLEPADHGERTAGNAARAKVVDIASARYGRSLL